MESVEAATRVTEAIIAKLKVESVDRYIDAHPNNKELLTEQTSALGAAYGELFAAVYKAVVDATSVRG